jgi:hypothetical protein
MASESALIPELEGEADEILPLRAEQRGDSRGVDSSGHGDGDGLGRWHPSMIPVLIDTLEEFPGFASDAAMLTIPFLEESF